MGGLSSGSLSLKGKFGDNLGTKGSGSAWVWSN